MQKRQSQIPFICKKLYEKNLIAGLEGNVSEKKGDHVLITASQVSKSDIQEKDLCWIDLNGNPIEKQTLEKHYRQNQIYSKKSPLNQEITNSQSKFFQKKDNQKKQVENQYDEIQSSEKRANQYLDNPKEKIQKPSSELEMHLAIYKSQKKAQAIIHAHPPSAIALSLSRPHWSFLPPALPEMIVLMGQVPIVPYTRPGTKELGENLKSFVKKHQVLILSNHGAVVWAESLSKTFYLMEQLEQCCKVFILAESLGGVKQLPKEEIEKLTQN